MNDVKLSNIHPQGAPRRITGIVVAAGTGSRLGGGTPKAFAMLCGRPVLHHSLSAMAAVAVETVAVLPVEDYDGWRLLVEGWGLPGVRTVPGGATRRASVAAALDSVSDTSGIVLVHDGARPLASPRLFADVIEGALSGGACVPVIAVDDSLKEVNGGIVSGSPDRSMIFRAQTPQGFSASLLMAAYATDDAAATDDASLVAAAGGAVAVVAGERTNIKITYPEDLAIAACLLSANGLES